MSQVKQSPKHKLSVTTPRRAAENNTFRNSLDQDFSHKVREANQTQQQNAKRISIPLSKRDTVNIASPDLDQPNNENPFEVDSPLQQEELMAEISEQSREDAASPDVRSRRGTKTNFKVKF